MKDRNFSTLSKIYQEPQTIFEPEKSNYGWFFGFGLLIVLLILAATLAGFRYFSEPEKETLNFSIKAAEEVFFGQEQDWIIEIENKQKENISQAKVNLYWPNNFRFVSSEPKPQELLTNGSVWFIGDVKRSKIEQIKFRGILFGEILEKSIFEADLYYKLNGYTSIFQKNITFEVLPQSPLALETNFPDNLSLGDEADFEIKINSGIKNLKKIKFVLEKPENFVLTENNLTQSENENFKIFENPSPVEQIKFKGYFKEIIGESAAFTLKAGLLDDNNNFFLQEKRDYYIFLKKPSLSLKIEPAKNNIDWGSLLPIVLTYQNDGVETLKNLSLKLKIDGKEFLDFERLNELFWQWISQDKFLSKNIWIKEEAEKNLTLSWKPSSIEDLKEINPYQKGQIHFSLPILSITQAKKVNFEQSELLLTTILCGAFDQQEICFEGEKTQIKINTFFSFETEARFYDDEGLMIGSGPFPPRVDQITEFRIFWRIFNTTNPLENIQIQTTLPSNVNWLDKFWLSHGKILYDPESKTISWQISDLPSYSGGPYSFVEASFQVALKPEEKDLDKAALLTEKTTFNAIDKFTGVFSQKELNSLDTNLTQDPKASNQGVVIR